jgi:hypothetical protein
LSNDEEEEEGEDTVSPLCTCGQMASMDRNPPKAKNDNNKKKNSWLESSFVHLMAPRYGRSNNKTGMNSSPVQQLYHQQPTRDQPHGFWEEYQQAKQLMDAAHGCDVELCMDCIDFVSAALEKDTQRLYAEMQAYEDAVHAAQQRSKILRNMDANNNHMKITSTEEAYQQEIDTLRNEVEARQEELAHLKFLFSEQMNISKQLDEMDNCLHLQQNSLEIQSNAFENRRDLLTKSLSEVLEEVDKLSLVSISTALFDLQVDPRGLRYPLINQLRLAFQPKGDVPAEEVQVAWSQATQLLLFLGKLFDYPGTDWKLVPLADCAKLIYRKDIFNLSPGDCRSLMALNALLDQVVRHAIISTHKSFSTTGYGMGVASGKAVRSTHGKMRTTNSNNNSVNSPPFPSSPTTIGDAELARLDPNDHFGWSEVIHCMASNLLWLSERGSELAATQVSSMSYCAV